MSSSLRQDFSSPGSQAHAGYGQQIRAALELVTAPGCLEGLGLHLRHPDGVVTDDSGQRRLHEFRPLFAAEGAIFAAVAVEVSVAEHHK